MRKQKYKYISTFKGKCEVITFYGSETAPWAVGLYLAALQ